VLTEPLAVQVYDPAGTPVGVTKPTRGDRPPTWLELDRSPPAGLPRAESAGGRRGERIGITGWAGPWPVDERWWASGEAHRRVRFQVSLADGPGVAAGTRVGVLVDHRDLQLRERTTDGLEQLQHALAGVRTAAVRTEPILIDPITVDDSEIPSHTRKRPRAEPPAEERGTSTVGLCRVALPHRLQLPRRRQPTDELVKEA